MADIQFQEEPSYAPAAIPEKGLLALTKKWGLAKDDVEAQKMLLGIVVFAVVAAVLVVIVASKGPPAVVDPGLLIKP